MDVSLTKVKCYLTNTCLGGKDEIRLFKLDLASASCYIELVNQLSLCYTEIGPGMLSVDQTVTFITIAKISLLIPLLPSEVLLCVER